MKKNRIWIAFLFVLMALQSFQILAAQAQTCAPAKKLTPAQKARLAALPPAMRTILEAVQRQKQTFCAAPGNDILQQAAVDPDAFPFVAGANMPIDARRVPDEVVATILGDGANVAQIAAANGLTVQTSRRSSLLDAFIVRFRINDGRSTAQVLAALSGEPRVETSVPQHVYVIEADEIEEARFAPSKIALNKIDTKFKGLNVRIAVIDTAVDESHPSLKGGVAASFDALPDVPVNDRTHGTGVAGLIAGRSMIRGVAPSAQLLVARAFDKTGEGKAVASTSSLLAALDWAVDQQAQIINMSFAGPRNRLLSRALAAASKQKILLIAAAGNEGPEAPAAYPAAEPWVLAVTATDVRDKIYPDANVGNYVFIAAPGVDVLVPAPDQGIDLVKGTSFAAPFVSGVAALLLEKRSDITPREIAGLLKRSALDLGDPGRDPVFGAGLVNAAKTLQNQ